MAMVTEAKFLAETRFLTVVDTYVGYCQVCHGPRVVGRIAVAGWEYHGTICSQCLGGLADEVQRRTRGLTVATADEDDSLAVIVGGNGHIREPVRHVPIGENEQPA